MSVGHHDNNIIVNRDKLPVPIEDDIFSNTTEAAWQLLIRMKAEMQISLSRENVWMLGCAMADDK